jgi:hypothetical protein
MSRIALSGDASGTGTFTIASPNSNSNFTLSLPTESGTLTTTASTPTFTGSVTAPAFIPNSSTVPVNGVFLPAANTVGFSTNSTERMRLDSSGNLGLGVTPSAWASTWKAAQVGSISSLSQGASAQTVLGNNFYSDGTNVRYIATGAASFHQQFSGAHTWWNAASGSAGAVASFTQAMTLDASGNLGVNATSIAGLGTNITTIEVKGKATDRTGGVRLRSSDNSVDFSYYSASGVGSLGSDSNHPLAFVTSGTEKARITTGGDLLVGTTTNTYGSRIVSSAGISDLGTQFNVNSTGTQYQFVQRAASRSFDFYVNGAGVLATLSATGVWTDASDIKYKKNIRSTKYGLSTVMQLQPRDYEMISGDTPQVGFIAQEVRDVIPELVGETVHSETKETSLTLSYGQMTAVLTKAIQELKAQNDDFRARLAALEAKGI